MDGFIRNDYETLKQQPMYEVYSEFHLQAELAGLSVIPSYKTLRNRIKVVQSMSKHSSAQANERQTPLSPGTGNWIHYPQTRGPPTRDRPYRSYAAGHRTVSARTGKSWATLGNTSDGCQYATCWPSF